MNIGFTGIERMGVGMVRNLLQGGHEVAVYNHTHARAEQLAADGATVVDNAVDVCRNELVISMLADGHAIEDIVFDGGDFLSALPSGAVHTSMATISAALGVRLAAVHAEAGHG